MMKSIKLYIALLIVAVLTSGCESMLDADSDRRLFYSELQPDTPNDANYSLTGIFSQLEKLAYRYVLLGELRGDLMDVTAYANNDLQEIYNFNISPDNPYNNTKDYYAVINNCNCLINTIDTSIVMGAEKVMYKAYAAAKAIRAWTYLQLVLNYGEVKYFGQPVINLKDTGNYVKYSLRELLPVLIGDLEPWKNIEEPESFSLGIDLSSDKLYFPVRFVLGDLYLWNGNYEQAAIEYHALIDENSYLIDQYSKSTWTIVNGVFVERKSEDQYWVNLFNLSSREQITLIAGSTEYGQGSELDSISLYRYEIAPSEIAVSNWDNQLYYHSATVYNPGDLRGDYGSYLSSDYTYEDLRVNYKIIFKYFLMSRNTSKAVAIYRNGLLYLRYAEAVNRAGKPNLAFAVLKHGMNSETLAVDTIVPRNEKYAVYTDTTGTFFNYVNFEKTEFDENIGVHARGCGDVDLAADFIILPQSSLLDSIIYVEDKIIEELALETAFEGNRFHDLMRIAIRRNNPVYLADRVSEKYPYDKETIRSKLLNESNWYLMPK
ncbi:MAG: RagB/SusD family nutrient uptake outer membrane protein [Bacteroidales bacterium]|nr:RagB/SusD family nutrient uptake outer membrane protein [Bacteroidales bacterium]